MCIFNLNWSLNNHLADCKAGLQRPKDQLAVVRWSPLTSEQVRTSVNSQLETPAHPVTIHTLPNWQSPNCSFQALRIPSTLLRSWGRLKVISQWEWFAARINQPLAPFLCGLDDSIIRFASLYKMFPVWVSFFKWMDLLSKKKTWHNCSEKGRTNERLWIKCILRGAVSWGLVYVCHLWKAEEQWHTEFMGSGVTALGRCERTGTHIYGERGRGGQGRGREEGGEERQFTWPLLISLGSWHVQARTFHASEWSRREREQS